MATDHASRTSELALEQSLARLKDALQTATDLKVPWDRFHDEFAVTPGYTSAAKVRRNEAIEKSLESAAQRVLDAEGPLRNVRLLNVASHGFWHGSCQIEPWNAVSFFFDDINMGLAGFFKSYTETRIELVRMTLAVVPEGPLPGGKRSFVAWSRKVGRAKA